MERLLEEIIAVFEREPPELRPWDSEGKPGGIIVLRQDIPTLIVPDLHGRKDYLPDLLHFKYKRKRVFDLLKSGKIQIVCVGDGMHAERRAAPRWRIAFEEYKKGFAECPAMTEEMSENFQTMAMIMRLKTNFPGLFHFLKGNHENITDEDGNGNHPFAKFAAEGPMTKLYVEKFYGHEFLKLYYRFEKNLPLLARGSFFVISHARPKKAYKMDELINYRSNPETVEGMTWTRHQAAAPGSTISMLDEIIGSTQDQRIWFIGHSAIKEKYTFWKEENLLEIHNPDLRQVVLVDPIQQFKFDKHVVKLPEIKKRSTDF